MGLQGIIKYLLLQHDMKSLYKGSRGAQDTD